MTDSDDRDPGRLYERLGAEGLSRLVAAFYRQVPDDPILGPMYPEQDFAGAEERLRWFLAFRLGGPDDYLRERGHPRLRMRHRSFPIDAAAAERWMALMRAAFQEAELAPEVVAVLDPFLADVAAFLINRR